MSLLVFTPHPDAATQSGRLFWQVLEHLQERWEGTLVLAGCTATPDDAAPAPSRDWVRLPSGLSLAARMLVPICRMYGVKACLCVGADFSGLDFPQDAVEERLMLLPPDERMDPPALWRVLETDGSGEWVAELDRWLAERLGVEVLAGTGCSVEEILNLVSSRSGLGRVDRVVIRWLGIADDTLRDLLERLPKEVEANILVELISAHLFDVPRGGLTHSPVDFLVSPDAWRQAGLFLQLVARAPARVEFRVISDSRRGWIQTSVSMANQATRLLRSWFRPRGGGGP